MPTLKHSSVDYLIDEINALDLEYSIKNPEEKKDLSKTDLVEQFCSLDLNDSKTNSVQEKKELPKVMKKKNCRFWK
ncbi:unnamed protein product [Cunninghamella echinulata]